MDKQQLEVSPTQSPKSEDVAPDTGEVSTKKQKPQKATETTNGNNEANNIIKNNTKQYSTEFPSWVNNVFTNNATITKLFTTDDEQAFLTENDAKKHTRFLNVKDVKTYTK